MSRYMSFSLPPGGIQPNQEAFVHRCSDEILGIIFQLLPLGNLNAARFACQRWWKQIMTNPVVLSSVMAEKIFMPLHLSIDRDKALEHLTRKLDIHIKPDMAYRRLHLWHIQYQQSNLDFHLPGTVDRTRPDPAASPWVFDAVACCNKGPSMAFLLRDSTSGLVPPCYTIRIYSCQWSSRPRLTGSYRCLVDGDNLRIIDANELHRVGVCNAQFELGDSTFFFYQLSL